MVIACSVIVIDDVSYRCWGCYCLYGT